jgi:ribosomal protein S18 acetylase RimI-like enzyme
MNLVSSIKNSTLAAKRAIGNFKRPSAKANALKLQARGENPASIVIREALPGDIPALATVHVKAWAETYENARHLPDFQLRERQWRQQFEVIDGSWFCIIAENPKGEFVGFAKGRAYKHSDLADFSGELNKIYLLRDYQRLGLGTKLLCEVARRFLDKSITSMVLFGESTNPSGYFHEAMGAEKIYGDQGEFHGSYGWRDLRKLAAKCAGK